MSKQGLDKEIRKATMGYIKKSSKVSLKDIVELIEPHIDFEYDKLEKMYAYGIARGLFAKVKDEHGNRRYFAVPTDDGTVYVDIDSCDDLELMKALKEKMDKKLSGISKSVKKITHQQKIIEGQISIQEYMKEGERRAQSG